MMYEEHCDRLVSADYPFQSGLVACPDVLVHFAHDYTGKDGLEVDGVLFLVSRVSFVTVGSARQEMESSIRLRQFNRRSLRPVATPFF